MLVAGLVAGALCAAVGWMVVTRGGGLARSLYLARQDGERALVTDCLANVDRVIEVPTLDEIDALSSAHVIDLTRFENVIQLDRPDPDHALTPEPPSIWRPPTAPDRRPAAAIA